MMRRMFGVWKRSCHGNFGSLALVLAADSHQPLPWTTPPPLPSMPPRRVLNRLLAGASPMGVADLKAMQAHVRTLTDQLMKCTVGVQVGNAQGSGVVISKDGYVLTAAHVAGKANRTREVLFRRWHDEVGTNARPQPHTRRGADEDRRCDRPAVCRDGHRRTS